MRASPSNHPLLVGRIRQDALGRGGDIVITKVKQNGVDRLKIFQRDEQTVVSRAFHRAFDWLIGNVNCTARIAAMFDAKADAEEASRQLIDEHFDIEIGSTLRSVRTDLERSSVCLKNRQDLFQKLGKINGILTPTLTTAVELAEEPWSGTALKDALIQNFRGSTSSNDVTLSESASWLAQCSDQRDTVFTASELGRAKEIYQSLKDSSRTLQLDQVRSLRELHRLICAMEERTDSETAKFNEQELYNCLIDVQQWWTRDAVDRDFGPLIQALKTPDQPIKLSECRELRDALAYLHSGWAGLANNPELKIALKPLIFKMEQAYAERLKSGGAQDAVLNESRLKWKDLRFMADDIRQCMSKRQALHHS